MEKKDLFSQHSKIYASFRPTYPESLYEFVLSFCRQRQRAWDCATGNGQVARRLASTFDSVIATDISQQQLSQAPQIANVEFGVGAAEETSFPDRHFDLITVGQALHWFQPDALFKEVKRVSRTEGVFAAWGYTHLQVNDKVDEVVMDYYHNVVGPYWDPARRLIENEYSSFRFPFELIETPEFFIETNWTLDHLLGYLKSWSATQAYIKEKRENPLATLEEKLAMCWPKDRTLPVKFPIFLKLGFPAR